MALCYIALGSNLNGPYVQVAKAIQRLNQLPHSQLVACSKNYDTAPEGAVLDQPSFVNAVVAIETQLPALTLLHALLSLEILMGRDRSSDAVEGGPRVIDLDVLTYGNKCMAVEGLTIPHPRMLQRQFVLKPLADIAPLDWVPPGAHASLAELLRMAERV